LFTICPPIAGPLTDCVCEGNGILTDNSLLILDDDAPLRNRLRRAMEARDFDVMDAGTVSEGVDIVRKTPPAYAVLDMKLEDGTGLSLVSELRSKRPDCRIVMLTGFGNIATAVAAVKAGALDYLPKPADPDSLASALRHTGDGMPPPPQDPMSADRVRWEHIQRVYEQCGRNVSETARRLRMHRRTLQRILSKHAPRV
jgi:two-component system response regulator RegA